MKEDNSTEISVLIGNESDYICLTDMAHFKDKERTDYIIQNWLRTRSTIEYLGAWEQLYNPNFNPTEFDGFRNSAGLNSFTLTAKQWIQKTNAIGIMSKAGRYGGTYAHKDIAFNFGMWLSPVFQLYIVKEYQRLKEQESDPLSLEWNAKRILSKTNYTLHTDAIKNVIIPKMDIEAIKHGIIYATEADMLNIILFGCKAKEWVQANPNLASKGINLRETASINQLVVLSNMESANSEMIKQGVSRKQRFEILHKMAKEQLKVLDTNNIEQRFRKILPDSTKK
ncbi:KilA-N domain-containing protein [Prevotella melaninogenica]|uniref:KilA-N domain-containing protein n=1 Tax=Prevotella melaninogenica TaxID=28132 RepID=UPI001BA906A6|nr:KilA-N domain-containing protein [Prevotella melaninogenica]